MPDVFSVEKRSEIMSRIRGKGNKSTELLLAGHLKKAGITGWRRHWLVTGRPDFAFPRLKVAVFVDGDFWHGSKNASIPQTNREFWVAKIGRNKQRDVVVNKALKKKGWRVIRIWESGLKRHPARAIQRIARMLEIQRTRATAL